MEASNKAGEEGFFTGIAAGFVDVNISYAGANSHASVVVTE